MCSQKTTKSAITDATRQLLRVTPIENLSVKQICEAANVHRSTFYRFFKDKYDVVNQIYFYDDFQNIDFQNDWNIWNYFFVIIQRMYEDRDFYRHTLQYKGQNSLRDYGRNALSGIIHENYGDLFPGKEIEDFVVGHFLDMSFDAFVLWLSTCPCPPPEKFGETFINLCAASCKRSLELLEKLRTNEKSTR